MNKAEKKQEKARNARATFLLYLVQYGFLKGNTVNAYEALILAGFIASSSN